MTKKNGAGHKMSAFKDAYGPGIFISIMILSAGCVQQDPKVPSTTSSVIAARATTSSILAGPASTTQGPATSTKASTTIAPASTEPTTTTEPTTASTTMPAVNTYNVEIAGFLFDPAQIRVRKGDTVVWTNADSAPHTVTSDSGTELDSAAFSKGQSFYHTFDSAGTFAYHCKIHPSMKAIVIVT